MVMMNSFFWADISLVLKDERLQIFARIKRMYKTKEITQFCHSVGISTLVKNSNLDSFGMTKKPKQNHIIIYR